MTPPPPFHADSLLAHAGALRALARALTWDDATADDLVQETWLTAIEKKPHAGEGLGAWLRAVMRRRFAHKQRAESARRAREYSVSTSESKAPVEERKSVVSLLSTELMQLDEPYQTTLFLRFFEERSVLEIARHYDTTTGTVGSRIHRGLELLRKRLDARSSGQRDFWLGALAPLASSKVQGVLMSGNAKLGVTAAALCALVFFVSQASDTQPLRATLETPTDAELAIVGEPRTETELAALERVADKPAPPVVKTAPPQVTEEPVPTESEELLAEWLAGERFQWPPAKNLWSPEKNKIKREFKLSFEFHPAGADASLMMGSGVEIGSAIEWDYSHTLDTTDTFVAGTPNADFERKMNAKWKSRIELLSNVNKGEWTKHGHHTEALISPLHKRELLFHCDPEGNWQVGLKHPKHKDALHLSDDLLVDMNLTALRPPAGIQEGTIWTVKGAPLQGLLAPAGDLKTSRKRTRRRNRAEKQPPPIEMRTWDSPSLLNFENPDGKLDLTCTNTTAHTNHVDGVLVERIVRGHMFSAELKVSFTAPTELGPDDARLIGVESFEQRLELEGVGSGSWDSEAQLVSSIHLQGTAVIVRSLKFVDSEWTEFRFHGSFELEITNGRH